MQGRSFVSSCSKTFLKGQIMDFLWGSPHIEEEELSPLSHGHSAELWWEIMIIMKRKNNIKEGEGYQVAGEEASKRFMARILHNGILNPIMTQLDGLMSPQKKSFHAIHHLIVPLRCVPLDAVIWTRLTPSGALDRTTLAPQIGAFAGRPRSLAIRRGGGAAATSGSFISARFGSS